MKQHDYSDTFNEFARIAVDQGLISEAEEKEDNKDSKDYEEMIQMLYGVKPNGKDEKHILDQAHPESPVIIAPSYDKLNGLVENLQERQNIIIGITQRPTNGNLTQHRYASARQDLVEELVRVGFEMDNKDEAEFGELRALADSCSERISKEAAAPLAGAAWLAAKYLIPTLLSYALVKNHVLDKTSQGVINDGINVVKALRDASVKLQGGEKDKVLGAAGLVVSLLRKLAHIKNVPPATKSDGSVFNMFRPSTLEDIGVASQQFSGKEGEVINQYLAEKPKVIAALEAAKVILSTNRPSESNLPEFLTDLSKAYKFFAGDSFKDAVKSINTFVGSLNEESVQANKVQSDIDKFLEEQAGKTKQPEQSEKPPAAEKKNLNPEESLDWLWGE